MSAVINKVEQILKDTYSASNYLALMQEILFGMHEVAPYSAIEEKSNFSSHIKSSTHVGTYTSPDQAKIIVVAVELKNQSFVENSRSVQRSYAKKLIDAASAAAAIIAFYTPDEPLWRLSFVRLDLELKIKKRGLEEEETLTPAKRYSFLVGKDEPSHTAVSQLRPLIERHASRPTLDELESAFSVEAVTKEFFALYKEKFHQLSDFLETNEQFQAEVSHRNFTAAQFAKKLMGQIVFLYFLQKKGWLGVKAWPPAMSASEYKSAFYKRGAKSRELIPKVYLRTDEDTYRLSASALESLTDEEQTFLSTCVKGEPWGTGPYNFMRKLMNESLKKKENFFEAYLEPLFYNALNVNRGEQGYDPALHCRIPFLSGGLFEPLDGYEWEHNNFNIPNEIFSNKPTKDRHVADGILDIFDRYNFTMSEDEPLEREVAIDPEMLGKVFENLLEVTDRKSKGAFYTPREIVHYMCQESLINYLTTTLAVREDAIRDFILHGDFMKDEDGDVLNRIKQGGSRDLWIAGELFRLGSNNTIEVNRMAELDQALQKVRVADPAVGSGAFPLGMLNEIVRARQNITTYMDLTLKIREGRAASNAILNRRVNERSAHRLKYETIRDCIFAVDIEPSAVDIAQLRLWLALVIDDEINPNPINAIDGHSNPLPLPNLECNILCGNSLIDEFEGHKLINESELIGNIHEGSQIDLYQSAFELTLNQLITKQEELYRCDNTDKKAVLLREIADLRDSVILSQLEGANPEVLGRYEETKHLASKPYTLWQLDFARVFREKGGFDIVIGNPPYIQLQKSIDDETNQKLGDLYSSCGFQTFAKTGDIYCLFYEKGNMLLRSGGTLAFITSNKWMRAGYGKLLRGYLSRNTNPLYLIDFAGAKVFDTATVDVNILIFAKEVNVRKTKAAIVKDFSASNLSGFVNQHSITDNNFVSSENWIILSSMEVEIKRKIEVKGVRLSNWPISIYRGILTGYNDAFIIDNEKRNELITLDPESEKIIRPILRGRDIKRYTYHWSDLWVIATFPSKKYDINNFPAVKRHLLSFGQDRLEQTGAKFSINGTAVTARKKTNNKWFETQDAINYWDDFSKPKIVWGNLCLSAQFTLINDEFFINAPATMIVPGSSYLLAVLNSSLADWYIRKLGVTRNGGYFEYKPMFVSELPVPIVNDEIQIKFAELVDLIIEIKTPQSERQVLETEIDNMVFDIYGLNDKERQHIIDRVH